MENFRGPVFISHGDADTIVPYELGKRLFDAANEPKTFYTVRNADHNDSQPQEYYKRLRGFLEEQIRQSQLK